MKLQHSVLAAALATGLGSLAVPAFADVYCPPNNLGPDLGPVTIDDNVIVIGVCDLNGTKVKGNVLVQDKGALTASDAWIEGNIQADGGVYVHVLRTDVDGDIQLEGLSEESVVKRSTIGGNLQMNSNNGRLEALYNTIEGDLQAFSNTGGIKISYNTIDGNLQCKSNNPKPRGGGNWVSGNKEDQCARL